MMKRLLTLTLIVVVVLLAGCSAADPYTESVWTKGDVHVDGRIYIDGVENPWESLGLPDQTGHAGDYLTTDGSTADWNTLAGGGDMTKAVYDPDLDGVIAAAQLDANIIYEGDARLTDARTPAAHNQDANTITTGTLDGDRLPAMSETEKGAVPLTGVPSGLFLKDDGTWAAGGGYTDENVDDRVSSLIQNGTGIAWTYDDVGNTLTGNVSITQYDNEQAQDTVGNAFVDTTTVDLTYNDLANTMSADLVTEGVQDLVGAMTAGVETGISVTYDDVNGMLDYAVSITQYTDELVDDRVSALIQNGTGLAWTYDDVANTLTGNVSITQYTDELAQDAVGGMIADTTTIDLTYTDGTPELKADLVTEGVEDLVGAMADGTETGISVTYNDATGNLDYAIGDLSGTYQATSGKDATGGYAGLTLFKINFKNVLNTFISFFTNSNTAARTYTFQDRDGTIADNTDITAQIPDALIDAKGDIITATAADTPAILASSAVNNNVLTVDTTTATGLKWAAPAGGNDPRIFTDAVTNGEQHDVTASVALTNVAVIDIPLTAGTYTFRYDVIYRSNQLTNGIRLAVNYTGTNGAFVWNWRGADLIGTASSVAADQDSILAAGDVQWNFASRAKSTTTRGVTLSVDTANADMYAVIEGVFIATGVGDLELWHGSELATAAYTTSVMPGTSIVVTKTK